MIRGDRDGDGNWVKGMEQKGISAFPNTTEVLDAKL